MNVVPKPLDRTTENSPEGGGAIERGIVWGFLGGGEGLGMWSYFREVGCRLVNVDGRKMEDNGWMLGERWKSLSDIMGFWRRISVRIFPLLR